MFFVSPRAGACLLLSLALLLLVRSATLADPPTDSCSNKCADRQWFIQESTLGCAAFSVSDCFTCTSARCKDPASELTKCALTDGQVVVATYEKGSCIAECYFEKDWAQATEPSGKVTSTTTIARARCAAE